MDMFSAKNDTIDPLSTVIKLFIYSFKPIGTKLSIGHGRVRIQEVGPFQSTVRSLFGDKKHDINILNFPVIYACLHYLHNDQQTDEQRVAYAYLFTTARSAFTCLKETYQGNDIVYNLDQLQISMDACIQGTTNNSPIMRSYNTPDGIFKQTMYTHINTSVWTGPRIQVILGLLHELMDDGLSDLSRTLALQTLGAFMDYMDANVAYVIGKR